MTRQIALDTETTGLSPNDHRIIEIGCVEIIDRKITGENYHIYINPEREVDEQAFRVHGISNEFLSDKPLFDDIVDEFMAFVNGSELIIHNAPFDVGFINMEFKKSNRKQTLADYCEITDTLVMAKQKHPGQRNSLDALCKRYDVDNSNRNLHGALLDSEILALVYLAMTGGQTTFFDQFESDPIQEFSDLQAKDLNRDLVKGIILKANDEELATHQAFLSELDE